MNPTAIQLFLIAIGLFVVVKYLLAGITITSLPLGWFVAEMMPDTDLKVYTWLVAVLIFAVCISLRYSNVTNTKTPPR